MRQFLKIGAAAKVLGVSTTVLRQWADAGTIRSIRTPGGHRLFDPASIQGFEVAQEQPKRARVLYSRVSSAKQRNDLERQKQHLRDGLPDQHPGPTYEVSDIGSGLNFKRPGLLRVLGLIKTGSVQQLVVASRDRLARFGFELIEWMCSEFSTQLVVLDNSDGAPEEELGKDLMSIVQVYCCRWNGRRRYQNQTGPTQPEDAQAAHLSDEGAEEQAEAVGRLQSVHVQQGRRAPPRQGKQAKPKRLRDPGPHRDAPEARIEQ
jgi:putative resolvase